MSTLALKGVLDELLPDLPVRFDATHALLKLLAEGERADLVIFTAEALARLRDARKVADAVPLGRSGVGVAVRAGAPKPDIGSVESLKNALLGAASVAHSKVGASGLHFAATLQRLGIYQQIRKIVVVEYGPVGDVIARGEAEIGVQQLCELAPVRGIDIVGALPAALQQVTLFSAGVMADALQREQALALVSFLRSEKGAAAMRRNGLEPA